MSTGSAVLSAFASRRSQYLISSGCSISDVELEQVVTASVRHIPSMFNMQSTRIIILFGEHHRQLWQLVEESLTEEVLSMRPNVAHEHFKTVQQKINTLKCGHGTILFFEDTATVSETRNRYPKYAKNFDNWSSQSSAMAQYAVWIALAEKVPDLGLTLQHYYPDRSKMNQIWDIPPDWEMTGQMPFGTITGPPPSKDLRDDAELVRVYA